MTSAEYSRNYYERLKREGKCPTCRNPPRPGKTLCVDCAGKVSKRFSDARRERAGKGMCTECGLKETKRFKMCGGCRRYNAERLRGAYKNRKNKK
jgi:hypothetical protein